MAISSCTGQQGASSDSKETGTKPSVSQPDQRKEEMASKDAWPFANPKNEAVITLKWIVHDGKPILSVFHDADDNGWQFLDGSDVTENDASIVSLEEITHIDPSVLELADLPPGWYATRAAPNAKWQRGKKSP
jgi:hypothetical protein